MGGATENINALSMGAENMNVDSDAQVETLERLQKFNASLAMAHKVEDRQKLYAIIESAFGPFGNFNKQVKRVLAPAFRRSGEELSFIRVQSTPSSPPLVLRAPPERAGKISPIVV